MRSAFLALAVLPLATACASREDGIDPAGVSDAMEKAGTSRVEMTVPYSRSENAVLRFSGVFDYERRRGRMEVTSSGPMDRNAYPPVEIDIGRRSYWPLTLGGRKRWYEFDSGSANSNFPGPMIPDQIFSTLSRTGEAMERRGQDEVRGVPTTRYRIKLTTEQEMNLGTFSPIDVWIDDEGIARRVESPAGTDLSVRVDFFDFGVPVDVEAPPTREMLNDKEFDQLVDADCASRKRNGNGGDVWWCAA